MSWTPCCPLHLASPWVSTAWVSTGGRRPPAGPHLKLVTDAGASSDDGDYPTYAEESAESTGSLAFPATPDTASLAGGGGVPLPPVISGASGVDSPPPTTGVGAHVGRGRRVRGCGHIRAADPTWVLERLRARALVALRTRLATGALDVVKFGYGGVQLDAAGLIDAIVESRRRAESDADTGRGGRRRRGVTSTARMDTVPLYAVVHRGREIVLNFEFWRQHELESTLPSPRAMARAALAASRAASRGSEMSFAAGSDLPPGTYAVETEDGTTGTLDVLDDGTMRLEWNGEPPRGLTPDGRLQLQWQGPPPSAAHPNVGAGGDDEPDWRSHAAVFLLMFGAEAATRGVYTLAAGRDADGLPRQVVLAWAAREDAERYAGLLEAEIGRTPTVEGISPSDLVAFASSAGHDISVVRAGALVVPAPATAHVTDWDRAQALREGRYTVLPEEPEVKAPSSHAGRGRRKGTPGKRLPRGGGSPAARSPQSVAGGGRSSGSAVVPLTSDDARAMLERIIRGPPAQGSRAGRRSGGADDKPGDRRAEPRRKGDDGGSFAKPRKGRRRS